MIASHPDLFCYALAAVAVLSHLGKEKYSPVRFRTQSEAGWFEVKDDYDPSDIAMFTLLMAIKWMAVGSIITIQAMT